jgi:uncharacterized protein
MAFRRRCAGWVFVVLGALTVSDAPSAPAAPAALSRAVVAGVGSNVLAAKPASKASKSKASTKPSAKPSTKPLGKACGGAGASSNGQSAAFNDGNEKSLRIGTGNVGGVFFPYGGGIGDAIRNKMQSTKVDVLSTGGSVDNLKLIAAGDLDLALSTVDAATDAVLGNPPYEVPVKVCALAVLYTSYVHILVLDRSSIMEIPDLAGKRVSVGSALSSTEATAERVLRAAGIDPVTGIDRVNSSLAESVAQILEGRIDALFWIGGVPTAAIVDLTNAQPIRFLSATPYQSKLRKDFGNVYQPFVLPAATYAGVNAPIKGLGIGNVLLARNNLSAQTVSRLLEAIFGDLANLRKVHPEARKLNLRGASQPTSIPFHVGAVRFYNAKCVGVGLTDACAKGLR